MVKKRMKTWGRMLTVLLAAALAFTSIPLSAIAETTEDYIKISTIEELYNIRNDLTANYILMNDIDLTEATAKGGDWDFGERGWNPIGSDDVYAGTAFRGVFDGNGHSIIGMRVALNENLPSGASYSVYVGLFANVTGEVRNLHMRETKIEQVSGSDDFHVGAIAGRNEGLISNCSVSGSVNAEHGDYVGGITGYNAGTVSKSYNMAEVVGYQYAGGIVGHNYTKIENCYNLGKVSYTEESSSIMGYSGGIAGYNEGSTSVDAIITGCYNLGEISGATASYRYAIANNSSYASVQNTYYLSGTGVSSTGATQLTEAQTKLPSMYTKFDMDNVWMMDTEAVCPYPQLRENPQDARHISNSYIVKPDKLTYLKGEVLQLTGCELVFEFSNAEEERIPVTSAMAQGYDKAFVGEQTLSVEQYCRTFEFVVTVEDHPFIEVRTVLDLYNIRYAMDKNYILMNDIDLTEATAKGGDWDFDGNGWNPIGSNDEYGHTDFSGIFDGNGYSISGMRIETNSPANNSEDALYYGLFSSVTGSIKNLEMKDVYINVKRSSNQSWGNKYVYAGAIAGTTLGGKIEKCHISGDISVYIGVDSSVYVGGFVGEAGTNSIISQCYNEANVSGEATGINKIDYTGGIAGVNYSSGKISNCYNVGTIKGNGISATRGSSGILESCYNAGSVTGYALTYNYSAARVLNSYYLSGTGTGCTGATPLTESQMKTKTMFNGFDFSSIWVLNEKAIYPYPQLQENLQDGRIIEQVSISSLPDKLNYYKGEAFDVTGLTITFEFENAMNEVIGCTNDMIQGYDATTLGQQELSVTYYGRTLTFNVQVEEAPYFEIYTIEDLYNIRRNLAGNYILMNDIDLSEATSLGGDWDFDGRGWNPIGSNDTYSGGAFSGTFDGNGYAISGMRIESPYLTSSLADNTYIGLFSKVTGEIRNLKLKNVNINVTLNSKYGYVGAIAGATSEATITKCSVTGNVSVSTLQSSSIQNAYVGGLVGSNKSNIVKSYSTATVNGKAGYSTQGISVGGIAGRNSNKIEDCYNTGAVSARGTSYSYVAGVVGDNAGGEILTSYNMGNASYGIVAYNPNTVQDCYYLTGASGTIGATALTEAQMKLADMYSGFDFENVWVLNSYANYPYAQLRNNVQDLNETVELVRLLAYPVKLEYMTDDVLDFMGAMFEAVYISGKTELVEIKPEMVSGYNPKQVGEQALTLTYGGQSDTFVINVVQRPNVTNVELLSEPAIKEYTIGTAFNFAGAQLKVYYDNETTEVIDVTTEMTSGGDINHIGEYTIDVTYEGYQVNFKVNVISAYVTEIYLDSAPTKLVYTEGEELDLTGMVVMATYSNGTHIPVQTSCQVTGYSAEPGEYDITVEFASKKATFTVTVNAKVLTGIEIKQVPKKLEYYEGQELDLSGLIVLAKYEDGEQVIVTDYEVSGYDGTAGNKVVRVTYNGKTATFNVNVLVKAITALEIVQFPTKRNYIENEAMNLEGLTVRAIYNDGDIKNVTDYKVSGFSSLPGTHKIYVSYEGQAAMFEIFVTEKVLSDLKVTIPTKTEYLVGETFDATGLKVVACYNNGTQVAVDDYQMTNVDMDSAGAKEVKITYGSITRSFVITVVQKAPIETGGTIAVGSQEARLGETIVVPVSVTKNTGLAGVCHTIRFDAANLEFVEAQFMGGFANGTMIVNDEKKESGEITILWFHTADVQESGILYNLNFKVLETATDGMSEIKIDFASDDNGNVSGENVLFEATNGGVEIKSYWLGDLTGDRLCKMEDLLMLAQYVSGKEMVLSKKQLLAADVNEDKVINIHDVIMLQQWLVSAPL